MAVAGGAAARADPRKTLGGLETDGHGGKLRTDGTALPGVYAVGEAAGFGGGGMHRYRALEAASSAAACLAAEPQAAPWPPPFDLTPR